MILFLNRNDEKWPHTRQIKIAGQNHILSSFGNCMENETYTIPKRELKLNVKLSENELNSSIFVLVRQHERPLLH
jgi:hypothetical protein